MPDVIIITTGDELLRGATLNSNSAFISAKLFGTNFMVIRHITTSDSISDIEDNIRQSMAMSDIVITTGGLGPTDDDNTVSAICRITGREPVIDRYHMKKMEEFFSSMKMQITPYDNKMVSLPEGSLVLNNQYGLAPGFITVISDKAIISMPGVPAEMENMFITGAMDYLAGRFGYSEHHRLSYKITGIRESEINSRLRDITEGMDIQFSITPKSGICDLVIIPDSSGAGFTGMLDDSVKKAFTEYLLCEGMESPEQELVHILLEKKLSISTAESCTGGLLAKRITDIAGSSEVFRGSVVAYSNDIKSGLLRVSPETLSSCGAVSEETAMEMASGMQSITGTDVCVSITGIAGPGGGTESKPVGMVCFGFIIKNRKFTVTRKFSGSRERVRTFASLYALNLLRKELR